MIANYRSKLGLSKVETFIVVSLFALAMIFAMANIVYIANLFGIHLSNRLTQRLIDVASAGSGVGGAFAAILGITIPAWAAAAATALGATAG